MSSVASPPVTPSKRVLEDVDQPSSKKTRASHGAAANTLSLVSKEVMKMGMHVRLNNEGLSSVDADYDWSEDVLRPGAVAVVSGFEDGWVLVNAGKDTQHYDEVFLEPADVGDLVADEVKIQDVEENASESAMPPSLILVVGECGDGKSFLINKLRDPERSGAAASALKSRGVTKDIKAYVGLPVAGKVIDYFDTPGIGDMDVTPMKVLTMIEQELIADDVRSSDAISGVIVTTPVPDGRVRLGAQIVQLLVEHGFVGEDKWKNVILVGTKADMASEEHKEFFQSTKLDEDGQPEGIAAQFFSKAPGGVGTFVMTSKDDHSQLIAAIARLPKMKVHYNAPDPVKMAEAFAARLGVEKGLLQKELTASREALQRDLDEQFAAKEANMKEEMELLGRQHQKIAEEQQRRADEQVEEMQRQVQAALEEKSSVLAQMRAASGSEAQALEEKAKELEEKRCRKEAQHNAVCRQREAQMEARERRLQAMMREIEEKQRQVQRARNYDFGECVSPPIKRCRHPRKRNWGNASGSGCKCLDCREELGR